jgi:hypothetical protein
MNKIQVSILVLACSLGVRANAATITVTYNFAGDAVGTPVISGSIEIVDHLSTGSVISSSPSLNTILNPFTLLSHDVVDFAALTLNGASTITFADGSTLFGHQFVDFSQPNIPETLIFTGGTGEFTGATGSFSGDSVVFAAGNFAVSGSGTINAPAIAPEPASAVLLLLGGLGVMLGPFRRSKPKMSPVQTQ